MQFAVVSTSKSLATADIEFMVAACAQQLVEFASAWSIDPWAAAFYSDVTKLPQDDIAIAWIVDALDEPDALGYHSVFGDRPYVKVLAQGPATSITMSHEFLETIADPTADRWMPRGDGTEVAVEVCDPCEGDTYPVLAEVAGEGRTVEVSNYVLGSWFDPAGTAPYDRQGKLTAPFQMDTGGYMVVLGRDGNESEVFARLEYTPGELANSHARWTAGRKLANPGSRLLRRLRGKRGGDTKG